MSQKKLDFTNASDDCFKLYLLYMYILYSVASTNLCYVKCFFLYIYEREVVLQMDARLDLRYMGEFEYRIYE
jgi:hypothetical protein